MKKILETFSKTEVRNIIALTYILLCLGYIYILAFVKVPPENKDLVNVLGGSVIGGLGLILAYFFGSSKGDSKTP
jgi:hypothetical protein